MRACSGLKPPDMTSNSGRFNNSCNFVVILVCIGKLPYHNRGQVKIRALKSIPGGSEFHALDFTFTGRLTAQSRRNNLIRQRTRDLFAQPARRHTMSYKRTSRVMLLFTRAAAITLLLSLPGVSIAADRIRVS